MPTLLHALMPLALCAALLGPLEKMFPHRRVRASARTIALCAALFLLNALLFATIGAPLLDHLRTLTAAPSSPARLLAALVLADLAGYFIHRAMHRWDLLWRFHRLHHAAWDLTWWETWRQHPVDALLHAFAVALPAALLGLTIGDGLALVLLRVFYTSFLHADLALTLGPLEGIIATPAFHRIHHSHDPRHRNHNFSTTVALIDRLFLTSSSPDGRRADRRSFDPRVRGMGWSRRQSMRA
jgi:sterol desaturase/sphingolipid hydroxylase (fatty acid hydroxylase superfamily)